MSKYLVFIIYLIFISLGLPDSLLGSGWPMMQKDFDVDSSYAGYVSMTILGMSIISSLYTAHITSKLKEQWVVIISIALTCIGLVLFSFSQKYWNLFLYSIPYGLGAGTIDASMNNYVAIHYSSRVMNFLHCFYGVGSMISPNIMALALKYKTWKEGYRWTAYIQIGILIICFATLPLWKNDKKDEKKEEEKKNDEEKNKEEDKKEIEKSNDQILEMKVNKKDIRLNPIKSKDNQIETKIELEKKEESVTERKIENKEEKEENVKVVGILEAIKIRGVVFSCLAFFTYCSGEGICFLWTSSFFDRTKEGLSDEAIAALSTTVFGGLMLGRVFSGLVSEKLGDKKLIRIGLIVECIGIICIGIPIKTYILAIIGFSLALIGMGPIFPSNQHLSPIFFGKEASATVTGMQMASAYFASTIIPFIFGLIQSKTSMWALPIFVGIFAILNIICIEIEFKLCENNTNDIKEKENTEKNNENKEVQ